MGMVEILRRRVRTLVSASCGFLLSEARYPISSKAGAGQSLVDARPAGRRHRL
jgi:hypothetical protein